MLRCATDAALFAANTAAMPSAATLPRRFTLQRRQHVILPLAADEGAPFSCRMPARPIEVFCAYKISLPRPA